MRLDSDKKFGELYSSAEALQTALTDLDTKHRETVSDTQIPLRFLTLRDGPLPEPPGNTVHLCLTRRADYDPNWGYVAVSYTWAQPEGLAAQFDTPDFKIWTSDTEFRSPYCPPSVLHRALQYDSHEAKTGRLWIDQECIDQDDAVDRDEHIAHMHRIYERSKCTAILLTHGMSSSHANLLQRCIEADKSGRLESFVEYDKGNSIQQEGDQERNHINIESEHDGNTPLQLERLLQNEDLKEGHVNPMIHAIFQKMAEDPYFTRAWTYQEQRCSKTSCFLIPTLPDSSSPDDETCGQDRGSIVMPNTFAHTLYQWGKRQIYSGDSLGNSTDGTLDEPMLMTLDLLLLLSKTFRFSEHELLDRRNLTVVTDRAAENMHAIWGMRTRDCKYVSDRVTIVANICGFKHTLRTTQFQDDLGASYSTCVLALLIMNQLYDGSVAQIMDKTIDEFIGIV